MTQSGQGEQPSARTPREGIVLPSDGGAPLLPGEQVPPAQQWDAQGWGAQGWDASQHQPQQPPHQPAAPGAGPLPPEGAHAPSYGGQGYGAPVFPEAALPSGDEAATQYISPVPAAPVDEAATQYIAPVPGAPAEAATQFIPSVAPGALPPEAGSAPGADAQATQYLPPVPPQPYGGGAPETRPTPDVFDSLFRSEPGDVAATRNVPHQQPSQGPAAPPAAGGRAGRRDADRGRARTGSRIPLLAAVGVGIVVLGVGAGALLSGGGSSGGGTEQPSTDPAVAAAASDAAATPSPSADPVKEQAVALDALLADSGDSRESVIAAVEDVKGCENLQQAGADLIDAAQQRGDLVTRLSELPVDQLPNHAELTTALTNAWKASESADNHYASWAGQVAGKKGCHKGQARTTGHTKKANEASATASAEKEKAAALWNSIAAEHGLTQRQASQL